MTDTKTSDLQYKFEIADGGTPKKRFTWSVTGPCGGVHIWAQFMEESGFSEKSYGGIEVHSNKPLYDDNDKPSQEECWLIGGPCWHDGSSLWFVDNVQAYIEAYEDDPNKITDNINIDLKKWYEDKFGSIPNDHN